MALTAPAQEPPPASAEAKARLRELSWVIGAWVGSTRHEGKTYTHRLESEWTLDGHFIESRYQMSTDGQVIRRDRSMIGWDRAKETLVWWGENEPQTKEGTWVVVGSVQGESYRAIIVREGPDRKTVRVQFRKEGDWVDASFVT